MVDGLLAGGLPPELRDRVVTLADGNPLFTEELVRMFVDRGVVRFVDDTWQLARPVEEVEIPGSIQAVLAARLDGLPAAEKRAAQNASVVGRIFWDALIAHLARQGTSRHGRGAAPPAGQGAGRAPFAVRARRCRGVRLPARPHPRRRLRLAAQARPRRQAPRRGALGGGDDGRPPGRDGRAARRALPCGPPLRGGVRVGRLRAPP